MAINETFVQLAQQRDVCRKIEQEVGIACDEVDLFMIIQIAREEGLIPPIEGA